MFYDVSWYELKFPDVWRNVVLLISVRLVTADIFNK